MTNSTINISGIGEAVSGPTKGKVQLVLKSLHSENKIFCSAHVIRRLTSSLPSCSVKQNGWPHLLGLELADPSYLISAPIDLIAGADVFNQLIEPGVIKAEPDSPVAQLTKFGWIVHGPTGSASSATHLSHHVAISNEELDEHLKRFWVQEEIPETSDEMKLTPAESNCLAHFEKTHSRNDKGQYVVRYPLCDTAAALGDSFRSALAVLLRSRKRFDKDPEYAKLYTDFLKEYEELGHMRRVSTRKLTQAELNGGCQLGRDDLAPVASAAGGWRVSDDRQFTRAGATPSYFLPHHGVLRESSETTKLRVVFNGSAKTSSGKSLNDIMYIGPKLQTDLADVLLYLRQYKFIFSTDITKMFRQIQVHPADQSLQLILWIDEEGNLITYQLTTVTYGTRSAPFLAIAVIRQLAKDEGPRFPLAVEPLEKGTYVDDIGAGADTPEELGEVAAQVKGICAAGGFPLAKWHSNCPSLSTSDSTKTFADIATPDDDDLTRMLGLLWQTGSDTFTFATKTPINASITKRTILSETAQLFDPLGFISPLVIKAKILLQNLWVEKLGWDDAVSADTARKWTQFREELAKISTIAIPRWLGLLKSSVVEIHGFSDASQNAMAAVVYLKVVNGDDLPIISLVCSKTKVAPLKRLTIPRLELSAAVLLAKLVEYVRAKLKLMNSSTFLWTDSSVTHTWISSHPSRWKEYVRNRVSLIQELTHTAKWKYVPGKENPADCASRGLSAAQLVSHKLWWTGPPWLAQSSSSWPSSAPPSDAVANLEEKPGVVLHAKVKEPETWSLLDYSGSLDQLLRITARWQRYIAILKDAVETRHKRKLDPTYCSPIRSMLKGPLTPGDIQDARLYWVKETQAAYFPAELKLLSAGQQLNKASPLARLTAFVDRSGLLRVGGRLKFSNLSPESKQQVILPRDSNFTKLVIRHAHLKTLHGGAQLTLAYLRTQYWIIGGRVPVRSFILTCVTCTRYRGERAQQLMGQLPTARVTQTGVFRDTGVDYAGPLTLKAWKGRGCKTFKGWIVVFVCMATSAVHLDAVTDYTAEAFIAAYRRFVARRGLVHRLHSDCGTNFQGACKELQRLFTTGTKESEALATELRKDETHWSFFPPGAPHFGGKWEATVKSVKHHLNRTIGDDLLTYEDLATLLAQIEMVLNSRPLEPLTEDPEDCSALTAGHFLTGKQLNAPPEPSLKHLKLSRLSRWRLIQRKYQDFWERWSNSYLQQLQSSSKWRYAQNSIKVGSMVLLTDERYPPAKWPLARVIALHPGRDGLTRVVTIRTATTTLDRPIAKLVILPIEPCPELA